MEKSESSHLKILEFDLILKKVAAFTVSDEGESKIESLSPFFQENLLKKELHRVTEMMNLIITDDSFPLHAFGDLRGHLKRAKIEGAFIKPAGLLKIKEFLTLTAAINLYINERKEKYPLLMKLVRHFDFLPELLKKIDAVIDSQGDIKDDASKKLTAIQNDIRKKNNKVRKHLEAILQKLLSSGYTKEENLVIRQRRLVIPVKDSHRSSVKGYIVDRSSSGATLFIEPLSVIELNNEIQRLKSERIKEIERILKRVTDCVRENMHPLEINLDKAGEVDSIHARAVFSQQIDGNAAETSKDSSLKLINARHPLLLLRESVDEVVPLNLEIGGPLRTLVITGPNAGGKTVALKTVGLLSLMHQYGLHVPAEEGTFIPLFSGIFADIGDRQSIQHDLSTFTSHIKNLADFLNKTDSESLVLLDEIGSSTDPAEGAVLAEVILKRLTDSGCMTLATTHMGALKVFAHQQFGFENGSMVFDRDTLSPAFIFQMGVPGSSYAFEIAEKYGMDQLIIEEAKKLLGSERGKLDRLIIHLENELQRSAHLTEKADIRESRLSGLIALYNDRLESSKKDGDRKKEQIIKEAEDFLKNANVDIERIVREIKEKSASREAIKKAKNALQMKRKKVREFSDADIKKPKKPLAKGDFVAWPGHQGNGKIISEPDSSGRVLVDWNGIRLRVSVQELLPGNGSAPEEIKPGITKINVESDAGIEIDLRGMRALEAVEMVDRYLSDAVMKGFTQVRIIHGKGTGVLKRDIGKYLSNHDSVNKFRLGDLNEGGSGVTIVELK